MELLILFIPYGFYGFQSFDLMEPPRETLPERIILAFCKLPQDPFPQISKARSYRYNKKELKSIPEFYPHL